MGEDFLGATGRGFAVLFFADLLVGVFTIPITYLGKSQIGLA